MQKHKITIGWSVLCSQSACASTGYVDDYETGVPKGWLKVDVASDEGLLYTVLLCPACWCYAPDRPRDA